MAMSSAFNLSSLRRSGTPGTLGLVALFAVCFVLSWLGASELMFQLGFRGFSAPWGVFTYPLASSGAGGAVLFVILGLLWLWSFGTQVERDLGTGRFLGAFAIFTVIGALFVGLAGLVTGSQSMLFGSFLPVSILTVVWCGRNPTQTIMMMGIFPLLAKWLAVLTAVLVLFSVGDRQPIVGAFALIPVALGWAWGSGKLPIPYSTVRGGISASERKQRDRKEQAFRDKVTDRKKEREERERLRRMFEDSLKDDK
jgi:membrane associated rhomboid family serine protease